LGKGIEPSFKNGGEEAGDKKIIELKNGVRRVAASRCFLKRHPLKSRFVFFEITDIQSPNKGL